LLRHVVGTGLRFAFHQLGLPLPDRPPVRIFRLRLYLDTNALDSVLEGQANRDEVVGSLIDPAGCAHEDPLVSRLRGALWFHQVRLRLRRFPEHRPKQGSHRQDDPEQLWKSTRQALTRLMPILCDAFLAEVVASLSRRQRRLPGKPTPPCLSREAWKWLAARHPRLSFLGSPDPLAPSWEDAAARPARSNEVLAFGQEFRPHPLRGRFREHYRAALNEVKAHYDRLAESALSRGLLERPSDAYFIPFDLASDLTTASPPAWIGDAVGINRREYETLQTAPPPPDQILSGTDELTGLAPPSDWKISPLSPLP
jgi:hypothetical protein